MSEYQHQAVEMLADTLAKYANELTSALLVINDLRESLDQADQRVAALKAELAEAKKEYAHA